MDTFLSILGVILGAGISIIIAKKNLKHPISLEHSKKLVKEIFIPYHDNIELKLFQRHDPIERIETLKAFQIDIENKNFRFYFSNRLLIALSQLTSLESEALATKKGNRIFKRSYYHFSHEYFYILNHARKMLGLEKRNLDYQLYFKLLTRPRLTNVLRKAAGVTVLIALIMFIVLLVLDFISFAQQSPNVTLQEAILLGLVSSTDISCFFTSLRP